MASVFTWIPTYGSAVKKKTNAHRIQFGDGYEQRISTGLNNLRRTWDLTFANRTNVVADAIDAFLSQANGKDYFTWVPPHGPVGKWVCVEWEVQQTSLTTRTVTATFEEVFDI